VLLAVSCFVVFIGTIWPLVAEMFFDRKLSVGPPFFDGLHALCHGALAILLPLGSMLPWKRGNGGKGRAPDDARAGAGVALGALAWAMQTGNSALGPLGLMLGTWVVMGAASTCGSAAGAGAGPALRRISRLPRADWGKTVAHAGFGITVFAVAGLVAWESEDIRVAQIGETFEHRGYQLTLTDVRRVDGPNYTSTMGFIDVPATGASSPR
jgi:cytochrome c-type biogenesis protein CcmF